MYTLDSLADDAIGLLEALDISRCHFVGLSLGGVIAQVLALRGAKQVASVALCATSSRIPQEAQPVWDERIQIAQTKSMSALAPPTLDRWLTAEFQRRAPDAAKRVLRMIETTPVAGYVGCASAIRSLNLTDRLKAIALPTVIIVGKQDPGTPVAASEAIHREIKGSKLVVLDDAMHPRYHESDLSRFLRSAAVGSPQLCKLPSAVCRESRHRTRRPDRT